MGIFGDSFSKIKTMPRRLILFALTGCFIINSHAQQTSSRFFIELTPQVAIPAGDFASQQQENPSLSAERKGWAETGMAVAVSGGYNLSRHWAVLLDLGYRTHGQDLSGKKQKLNADGFNQDVNTWGDAYKILHGFLGLQYSVPLSSKMDLEFRAFGGAVKVKVPGAGYDATSTANPGGGIPVYQERGTTAGISAPVTVGWSAGAGLSYRLNGAWSLGIRTAFTGASPAYNREYYYEINNGSQLQRWQRTDKNRHPVNAVTAGLCLRYSF